jgi:hypothetical protein
MGCRLNIISVTILATQIDLSVTGVACYYV